MKTRLKLSVIMLLFLAVMFFAATFIEAFTNMPVYDNPVALAVLSLLVLLTAICCFSKRWLTLKKCGFIVCHMAVVVFFIAAFVWHVCGVRGNMVLYAGGNTQRTIYEVDSNGEILSYNDLPFTVGVSDFEIEYHPYEFIYSVIDGTEYIEKGSAKLTSEGFDCGKYGIVPVSEVYNSQGQIKTQIQYKNLLLTWNGEDPGVKQYRADIYYSDGETDAISVNRPTVHNGWKIYLMSYSYETTENGMNWIITLQIKRDPVSFLAATGLILCPIGTFLLCMRPRRPKNRGEEGDVND